MNAQFQFLEETIMTEFRVSRQEIYSETRGKRHVAHARQIMMYLAHTLFGINQKELGKNFDRDRTTIIHACHCIEDEREDRLFDSYLDVMEKRILSKTPHFNGMEIFL